MDINRIKNNGGLVIRWICIWLIFLGTLLLILRANAQDQKLWYNKPSQKWTDALPIGNGRLGAMIFGDALSERVQFNEQTLWTGQPRQYQRNGAYRYLPEVRRLIFAGKQAEAEALAQRELMGRKSNEEAYPGDSAAWLKKVHSNIAPSAVEFDDANWKGVTLPAANGWETIPGFEGLDGAVWLRTTFDLPAGMAGKNMILSPGRIRDMDYTYVNGKLIGSTVGPENRKYAIPATLLHPGKNQIAIQVINYYDKGGLTGSREKILAVYPEGGTPEKGIVLNTKWKYWIQDDNPPAYPRYNADYQPFADLYLQFPAQAVSNYKRDLDISNATAHVYYTAGGVSYSREYLASNPDNIIAIHLSAGKPGQVNFTAQLKSLHRLVVTRKVDDHTLEISFRVHNGVLKGVSYLHAGAAGGRVTVTGNGIEIAGADDATLYLTAATNYKNYHDVSADPQAICKNIIDRVAAKPYAGVRAASISDYQKYFDRFSIRFGEANNDALPTGERILKFTNQSDPALIALYLQYGRYLMISSSRPGSGPANLQGLWNDLLTPPWGSKFTTNINLEMNYWPAEVLNLSACSQPLFSIIDDLSKTGRLTAREHYDAPGWVLHHNTDLWRGTAPVNASNHGIWVSGGAWLCHQLWEHYLFSKDKVFLQSRAYPEMKGAAEFFVHFLVKDPKTGYLISAPSNSPEHGGLVAGPTMDHQIIRDLYKNCIAAARVLGIDQKFADTLKSQYSQIAPNKIGRYGQLQEWMEDKDDTADTHRHVSHLWGVFPGTDITWDTPDLLKAAKQSLIYRGDEGTGWSVAWKVNLWARLRDGDHALRLLDMLLSPADAVPNHEKGGVYHNLFDAHPPFQIDGNFGGAAGISEMLLQSQMGAIDLLPALPAALPEGEVRGIRARGDFTLNFNWRNGILSQVEVTSGAGGKCIVRYQGKEASFQTIKGKTYKLNADLKQI